MTRRSRVYLVVTSAGSCARTQARALWKKWDVAEALGVGFHVGLLTSRCPGRRAARGEEIPGRPAGACRGVVGRTRGGDPVGLLRGGNRRTREEGLFGEASASRSQVGFALPRAGVWGRLGGPAPRGLGVGQDDRTHTRLWRGRLNMLAQLFVPVANMQDASCLKIIKWRAA